MSHIPTSTLQTPFQGQDRERTLAAIEESSKGNCFLKLISQIHFLLKNISLLSRLPSLNLRGGGTVVDFSPLTIYSLSKITK